MGHLNPEHRIGPKLLRRPSDDVSAELAAILMVTSPFFNISARTRLTDRFAVATLMRRTRPPTESGQLAPTSRLQRSFCPNAASYPVRRGASGLRSAGGHIRRFYEFSNPVCRRPPENYALAKIRTYGSMEREPELPNRPTFNEVFPAWGSE